MLAAAALGAASGGASALTIVSAVYAGPAFSNLTVGTIEVGELSDLVGSLFVASIAPGGALQGVTLLVQPSHFTGSTYGALSGNLESAAASFRFVNVPPGRYVVKASGTLDGAGPGLITSVVCANYVLSPVPEPKTWALMLAGLGVVGFVAARRNPQR